jgi:superfamily II DNA or RNA helicase
MMEGFLGPTRLLHGPWQAFERDVARLLIHAGFEDVRIVAGSGDHGADVLAVRDGRSWVVQCKHSTTSSATRHGIEEVANAAEYYGADRMVLAISRSAGPGLLDEQRRFRMRGLDVAIWDPAVLLAAVERAPLYPPVRKSPRDYQETAIEKFRDALVTTGQGMVVLATGLGKTVVMAQTVSQLLTDGLVREGRVLVLADKKELVNQLQSGFWSQLPKTVATHILTGVERPSFWDGITFATVQSIAGATQLPHFDLVLVDEAHHAGSETFQTVLSRLGPKMLGGVTATPWRGDDFNITTVFGQPQVRMSISDGLRQGYLSEVDYRLMADNIDWQFVQEQSENAYSVSQLNKRLIIPTRDDEAARNIAEVFGYEKRRAGIVFSPSLDHAREFAGRLRGAGLRAEAIGSDLTDRERDKLMSRFRKGHLDFMTTVDLFNEGVDVPDVDLVVFMRVTHSRRIFVQQLGRGLRLSPGKSKVVVMDFVTDLRRIVEVVELEGASRSGPLERMSLGERMVSFRDAASGKFLLEWLKDQADLLLNEEDPKLRLPRLGLDRFEFPDQPRAEEVE